MLNADTSRDRRIEDPTNRWVIHRVAQALVPLALGLRISANAVSITGLLLGLAAARAYWHWSDPRYATVGFLLCCLWLIADGLDGMVARATQTSSALGRVLDGVCDHIVFIAIYCTIAGQIGTAADWGFAIAAGAAHILQSSLYESERARFHRRCKGDPGTRPAPQLRNVVVQAYDAIGGLIDRAAVAFDAMMARAPDPAALGARYGAAAAPPLMLMASLSANVRVIAIYLACLAGSPRWFWWFELVPLSLIAATGLIWHRRVESRLVMHG